MNTLQKIASLYLSFL